MDIDIMYPDIINNAVDRFGIPAIRNINAITIIFKAKRIEFFINNK